MTNRSIPVTEDELHAYVDNELPAERRGDVEAWLATHPDDAERVQSWRTMAEALRDRAAGATAAQMDLRRGCRDIGGVHRWRRHRLGGAWRCGRALGVPELYRGCARCAPALRGRGPPSRRSARQRTHPSPAMADQALRLGCPRA